MASGGAFCTGWTTANTATVGLQAIPDVGVSDEEPALFTSSSLNLPSSCATVFGDPAACGATNTVSYTSTPVLVQAMGVVASSPLISALQAAGSAAGGKANLSSHWITTAFTKGSHVQTDIAFNKHAGATGDWGPLGDLVSRATGVTSAAFQGSVVLCRRAAGSGTQASLQARFLNVGCAGTAAPYGAIVGIPADTTTNTPASVSGGVTYTFANPVGVPTTGYYEVFANGSSGTVKTCMAQAASAGLKALGVLSLDQSVTAGQFDFVAIDGVAATDATVANGAYTDWVESTLQQSKSAAGATLSVINALKNRLATVATQSAAGVYNIAAAGVFYPATASPKQQKGNNSGVTCKHPVY